MMSTYSRPSRTSELIERLGSPNCTVREARALGALCRSMVASFRNAPKLEYMAEAAAISAVIRHGVNDMDDLIIAFSNAIISGTTDASIKETEILSAFAFVLRHTKELPHVRSRLGPVLQSLNTRLKAAGVQADTDAQYHLVICLSGVLDAMADIKFSGISRESLHEPLGQELQALSQEVEPRLAQAAAYASQALRGVSDDEGPWQAAWRYTNQGISVIANTAGAVAKVDLSQLYATIPDVINLVQGLQSLFENATEVAEAVFADREWIDSMNKFKKPKRWYRALRYIDLFLQCKAWEQVKGVVTSVNCREEKHFLSGLYSLLESTWIEADQTGNLLQKEKVVTLLKWTLATTKLTDPLVQAWASLAANTVGCSSTIALSRPSGFKRWIDKKYESKLCVFHQHNIASNPSTGKLLAEAWRDCIEAKVYYANAAIQHYYTQGNRLDIERLSGERLPLHKCYINLALTSDSVDKREDNLRSYSRQDSWIHADHDSSISLSQLFDPKNSPEGESIQSRRIFIQGRAGIGKTTLCKKIVDEFLQGRLARDMFDHILWIPLRKLKNKTEKYTLTDLLHDEYFSHVAEGHILAETVDKLMHDTISANRVLCLLDGLDEVSQRWDRDTSPYELLQRLLLMPSVIITSRPQVASFNLGTFDLELETIGFQLTEVKKYVKHCISDKSKLTEVEQHLKARPFVQDIARIPIQLDALCYVWMNGDVSRTELNTVTNIYQLITEQLWKKDIVRTNKQHEGLQLTQRQAQNLKSFQIATYMKVEEELLEEFAFQGIQAQIFEFTPQHCDAIASELHRRKVPIPTLYSDTLGKLSFLRASATVPMTDAQSYHFLHLTFQEFFAAKHFARYWLQGKDVSSLKINVSGTFTSAKQMSLVEMIHEQKYNPRYMVFWRFVVGLIQAASEHAGHFQRLADFWDEFESEPIDLIGTVHHELLTNTLSELFPSDFPIIISLRSRIEAKLCHWAVQQIKISNSYSIAYHPEFPDSILGSLTKDADRRIRSTALQILSKRSYITPTTITLLAENVPTDLAGNNNVPFIALMARQHEMPKAALQTLLQEASRTHSYNADMRFSAREALTAQMNLYEFVGAILIVFLNDDNEDGTVRVWAARTLQAHGKLSERSISTVLDLLKSESREVCDRAAAVLAQHPHIPLYILEAIFKWLEHVHKKSSGAIDNAIEEVEIIFNRLELFPAIITLLRSLNPSLQFSIALRLLRDCDPLPQGIWDSLLAFSRDISSDLRRIACIVMSHRADTPLVAFSTLIVLLQDKNYSVSDEAARSLKISLVQLPQQILVSLTELLADARPRVRKAALSALPKGRNLTLNTLNMLHACLKSTDREERFFALDTLSNSSMLPLDLLHTLITMVNSEESVIRDAIIQCLQNQTILSSVILRILIKQCTDDENVVGAAISLILEARRDLPRNILDLLLLLLKTGSKSVQRKVCPIMMLQHELPTEVKNELLLSLKSTDAENRALSTIILGYQLHQSQEVIHILIGLVSEEDIWIAQTAGEALENYSDLPEELLIQIIRLLQDNNAYRRLTAYRVVSAVKELPAKAINILVEISNSTELDPHSGDWLSKLQRRNNPRKLAMKTLLAQPALSDVALQQVSNLINDKDYTVVRLAFEILTNQKSLPLSVIQVITDFLNRANYRICQNVVDHILRRNADLLYNMFSDLHDRVVATVCYCWFISAACYVRNGVLWVRFAGTCRRLNVPHDRLETVVKIIQGTKNRQLTLAIAQETNAPKFLPLEGYDDFSKPLEGGFLGHSWGELVDKDPSSDESQSSGQDDDPSVVESA